MYTSLGIKHEEMLRILRDRVEDPNDLAFSLQQKYDALDKAKRYCRCKWRWRNINRGFK